MKSIGEILTTARKAKGLSATEVSKITKIDPKYIAALERDDFTSLPPATFTKGFIRNYAQVVGKSPDEMIAIFRRDFAQQTRPKKNAIAKEPNETRPFARFFGLGNLLLLGLGALVFLGYLAFQYRALIVPPPLTVIQPTDKAVLTSPVMVEGKTSSDSLVTVGESGDLRPDSAGVFSTTLNFSPGEQQITVKATNRFGREKTETISFTVISRE